MERSPSWETNSHSANQEIPHLLWNSKIHYRVDKSPSLVRILSQIHPVHNLPSCFSEILFDIIPESMPCSSDCSPPFRFSDQNFARVSLLPYVCYSPHPFIYTSLGHLNNIWWSVHYGEHTEESETISTCILLNISQNVKGFQTKLVNH
jgi:hypothetical protein